MNRKKKDQYQESEPYDATRTVHNHEPDYAKSLLKLPKKIWDKLFQRMRFLYGTDVAEFYMPELERMLKIHHAHKPAEMIKNEKYINHTNRFTEQDVILITYGDLLRNNDESPISTLAHFCDRFLGGAINTLHILPFFPYSSDRGFAIKDFTEVDPALGSWQEIEELEGRYQLMFDGVINHISSKSRWFHEFLNGSPYYRDFFITYDSPFDLTEEQRKIIFRPRTTDILTRFYTINGPKYVWSTFSSDQVDLNYRNPNVLIRVIDILLMYVRHGADIIRLDAVTFLWSEPGTTCIHLQQTHEIVKLFRDVLNAVAPHVALITETNVPHEENISYFGNGYDEAQMVYNFALPPLVLHTFYSEDVTRLSKWASELAAPSKQTTFFNFLDSHDGIGLMAVKNILNQDEINHVIKRAEEHGAFISYKTGENGDEVPYELNVTWYSALNKEDSNEDIAFQVRRFVASRSVALVLQGVPGIYLHSMLGTPNDIMAVLATHSKRDINRTVLDVNAIYNELEDPYSKISRISRQMGRLINIRSKQPAFHPSGAQQIIFLRKDIFSVLRISPYMKQNMLCLINVSSNICELEIPLPELKISGLIIEEKVWYDLVSEVEYYAEDNKIYIKLQPYDIVWLESYNRGVV